MSAEPFIHFTCDRCKAVLPQQRQDPSVATGQTPLPLDWIRLHRDGITVFPRSLDLCESCSIGLGRWIRDGQEQEEASDG